MPLRDRIFAKFHQVATGTLRLPPEVADEFASHIANANEGLHVVFQLCTGANALQSGTLAPMLERLFGLVPEYEMPALLLAQKPGQVAEVSAISGAAALMLHSRVFEVCISERGLPESQALQVAQHVRQAASAFFALAQRCMAPETHTQKVLCSILRASLSLPLQHLQEAARVYLQSEA